MSERRAVALLSGGLDSGVAAALWQAAGHAIEACIWVDYDQLAAVPEAAASRALAHRLGARWRTVELPWLGELARGAGSALVRGATADLPETSAARPGTFETAARVWVPARNLVLVGVAAAHAEALGAEVVVVGFNREEAATFADNSAPFVAAMDAALALGTRSGVVVESPTLELDKPAIAAAARRLGLGPEDFWSCYRADGDRLRCRCESCVRSRRAWVGA